MWQLWTLAIPTIIVGHGIKNAFKDVENWAEFPSAESASYWDRVYRVQGAAGRVVYEWYGLNYLDLQPSLDRVMPSNLPVLVVGAGDSELSADMFAAGWDVTSIDFSAESVARMRRRYPDLASRFHTMDARNMTFESNRFGTIFDKGLSDCLNPETMLSYFEALRHVLHPEGALVVVSQKPLSYPEYFGDGWSCDEAQSFYGPLFVEVAETKPPQPLDTPHSEIPYYFQHCWKF